MKYKYRNKEYFAFLQRDGLWKSPIRWCSPIQKDNQNEKLLHLLKNNNLCCLLLHYLSLRVIGLCYFLSVFAIFMVPCSLFCVLLFFVDECALFAWFDLKCISLSHQVQVSTRFLMSSSPAVYWFMAFIFCRSSFSASSQHKHLGLSFLYFSSKLTKKKTKNIY